MQLLPSGIPHPFASLWEVEGSGVCTLRISKEADISS